MIETLQEITLNMHGPRNDRACVEAQQSDTGSRKVRIHLQSFDGPYKIPADAKVVLYVRKLDGHKVLNDCEIEDESTVLMTLTTQTVACSGRQTAQLYIFNDEGDIKSQSFCINVPRSTYSDDAVQSADEFGALQTATTAADKAAKECVEATAECLKATEEISTAARSHASAIVVSASGEDIVLADSADAELQGLKLFGRTEQETTTGKNLWNPEWVMSAYFFTDGIIANSTTKMIYIPCEPNTTYTVSKLETTRLSIAYTTVEPGTGTAVYGYITYTGTTSSAGTITTGDDAAYLVAYVYNTNNDTSVTFEEMLASIQIEKGSAATDYEPYTGGIASPSPAYPQELVSAGDGGDIELEVCGGNLKVTFEQGAFGVSTGESISAAGWTSANRLKTPLLENKDYNITSLEPGYQIYPVVGDSVVMAYDKAGWHDLPYAHIANGYVYTRFLFRKSDDSEIGTDAPIMIFDCEETEVQSLTVSTPNGLPGIPVTDVSLANYTDADGQMWCCDEIDFARGVYVQRIQRYVFDGSADEGWVLSGGVPVGYRYVAVLSEDVANSDTTDNGITSMNSNFQIGKTGATYSMTNLYTISTGNKCYVSLNGTETLSEFQDYLAEHPMTLLCTLVTPVEPPLSEDVLAAYKALHTNYPVTTILNDAGAGMEIGYQADTKSYIDNRFAELQSAILSMGGNV